MTSQKHFKTNRSLYIVSIIFLFLFTLLHQSCKKTDTLVSEDEIKSEQKAADFFKLPPNTSPVLKRIANELERQNKTKEFITAFINKEGFPIWNKASIETYTRKIKNSSTTDFDTEGLTDTTVLIPLVVNEDEWVHGFIWAKITDTVALKVFRQHDYINFPFQTPVISHNITSAEDFALRMMQMDNDVFGHTVFAVKDKRLFNNSTDYNDTGNINRVVDIGTSVGNVTANGNDVNSLIHLVCVTIYTTTTTYNCTTPTYSDCIPTCDRCPKWCSTSSTTSEIECYTVYEEEGGGWPIMPGGGSGGGGNPPGGGGNQPPCVSFSATMVNSIVPIECDPGPGGNPWPPVSRHAEFNSLITNNDPDIQWWYDNSTDFPPQLLPSWNTMNTNFPKKTDGTEMCGADVYSLIGGQILANMPPGPNPNACALRVSRALNYSGIIIPVIPGHTYQGTDGKNYFLSSAKLYNFMKKTFKIPPNATNSIESFSKSQGGPDGINFSSLLTGKKGIYMMQASYPGNFGALGHATLYNGTSCVHNTCDVFHDGCYFNAIGGVEKITLFKLN